MLGDIGQRPPFSMPRATTSAPVIEPSVQERRALRPQASLASLYLATKSSHPLQVPPHAVKTPLAGPKNHFFSHLVRATQVDAHLLRAQVPDHLYPERFHTQYFILGDAIERSDVAVLRGMRSIDRDVSQIYVSKEFNLSKDYRSELFGSGHRVQFDGIYPADLMDLARQVNVQADIEHPMMPHFQLITHDKIYLVMPQMGANVTHVLLNMASEKSRFVEGYRDNPVRLGMAYKILQGVVGRLKNLHDTQVAHRDIKPENLMLRQDGDVYLIDYDAALPALQTPASRPSAAGDVAKISGTQAFFAPEVMTGISPHDGRRADIWSLGVTLVVTLTGQNPFHIESAAWRTGWQAAIDAYKQTGALPAASARVPADVAKVFADLSACAPTLFPTLIAMLDPDPHARPTTSDLAVWLQSDAHKQGVQPTLTPLLRELHLQSVRGLLPVDSVVAHDRRLMQPSPGERAALRPALRRANSQDNPLRPFVTPFDRSPKSLATAAFEQADWKNSPRFEAVQKFLFEEEDALFSHLTEHPEAAARIFALDP